jgi:opacity protein-like surface antigen
MTGGASAADLITPPPAAPVASATDWSGPYIGANVGYGPGTASLGTFFIDGPEGGGNVSFSGLFVGGQVGYNYQLSNGLVFGGEADLNWSNESGSTSVTSNGNGFSINDNLNWFGAVTGHVGYAWDNVMPYVLGGVAFANNTFGESCLGEACGEFPDFSSSATHMGYTVGGGVAAMLTDHISGFVEARYADYGSANYTFSPIPGESETFPISLVDTTVRAGLNFHF